MHMRVSPFLCSASPQDFLTKIIAIGLMALSIVASSRAQTVFQPLGYLDGYGPTSEATAISADGSKVVGYSAAQLHPNHACWWTSSGITVLPGTQDSYDNSALAVSADGGVIVGERSVGALPEAFYWTQAGQIQPVPLLNSPQASRAWGVNASGTIVVGGVAQLVEADYWTGLMAFRWDRSQAKAVYLPQFPSSVPGGGAYSVSDDGRRVIGWAQTGLSTYVAVYWDDGGAPKMFNKTGDTIIAVSAFGISSDGSVVAGSAVNLANGEEVAFKWTAAGGVVRLPNPTTGRYTITSAAAARVSGNGRVIVGYGTDAGGTEVAIVWADGQPYRVADIAGAAGVLPDQWEPFRAYGVDYTGNRICGFGRATSGKLEAYLLVIDATPAPPVVAPAVAPVYNKTTGALTIRYRTVQGLSYRIRGGGTPESLAPIGNWTAGAGTEQEFIAGSAITGGARKYFLQVEVKAGP